MTINANILVQENLQVVKAYLSSNQFDKINIIGNRTLQDLYAINQRDLMSIGLIIKEISFDLEQIRVISKGKPTSHAKKGLPKIVLTDDLKAALQIANKCTQTLIDCLNKGYSPFDGWDAYITFEDSIRKFLVAPEEREIYVNNYEFSKIATINYLNFLSSNESLLLSKSKIPIERTRAELALIVNQHGGRIPIISYLFIRAFEHTARFAIFGKIDDVDYIEFVRINLGLISDIVSFIKEGNESVVIERANEMVGNLMFDYRDYFGKFGELSTELSEQVPLSPDVAERIQKVIEKHQG